ncbi:uncharacterized protein BXZ73DRAFT_36265, partial [Epithele typhae]|uniref:uncharacterized protein n=1 Tax=Epithele typhae TaxID=378194 RepID=UPI0020082EB9
PEEVAQPRPTSPSPGPSSQVGGTAEQPQVINGVDMFARNEAVTGSFDVDPMLETQPLMMPSDMSKAHAAVWGTSTSPLQLNAAFRSLKLSVTVDVAVVGPPTHEPRRRRTPVRLCASTRSEPVIMNIREVDLRYCLDLHVESKSGDITVLLPPSFSGPIIIQKKKADSLTLLPDFATTTRTLRTTDHETVLLVSSPAFPVPAIDKPLAQTADDDLARALLHAKHGRITIGLS